MNRQVWGSNDQFLRHLATAVSTARLYSPEHGQVRKLCHLARSGLLEAMGDKSAMSLLRIDEQLAIDEQPLDRSLYNERFARLLKMGGIGHVKFLPKISTEELQALVASLAGREKVAHSSDNLRLGQVEVRHRAGSGRAPSPPAAAAGADRGLLNTAARSPGSEDEPDAGLREQAVDSKLLIESAQILEDISSEELARVMEVYEAVKQNRRLKVVGLSEIITGFINIFASYADPLLTLVPLRNMDEYTFTHSLNVCLLNLAQATALGIEGQLLHDIGLSAMLHDVGKLFIPEEILNKPGKLDQKEWLLIQEHPVRGAEYLLDTPGVPRMAVINAYEHHLRYDKRGYPGVKVEWQQSICSQLTCISDIYDSLRTRRPYREPIPRQEVMAIIEAQSGTQLHPLLARNFLQLISRITV